MSGTVAIALHQCRNLRCARGYPVVIIAKVEFGSKVLGESNRLECNSGEPFDIGFNTVLNSSEPQSLEEMAQYPLLVTLLEVLPKDKKAKEEKMQVLGQTCVDLLPLIMGETSLSVSQRLVSEQEDSGLQDIEMDIKVSVPHPLLQEKLSGQSNLLTLGARSLYSVPDSWQPSTFSYTMSLATPIPTSSQKLKPVVVQNGHLRLPSEPEPDQWRWPSMSNMVGKATLIPEGNMEQLALEDESGDLNTSKDVKFRRTAECNKPHVTWNTRHRCWLPPDASSYLLQELSRCPLWPVEVGRFSSPGAGAGKGKAKEGEEVTMSFHGVAYVNLAPLLYPGATRVCGAYLLHPYNEADINQKLQRSHTTLLEPQARSPTSLGKKAPGGGKRAASTSRITDSTSAVEEVAAEQAEPKTEGHTYLDARTYVHLEIALHRPLVPKRPASVLAERISEYIPPRPAMPKRVGGVDKAIQDFHAQTASIADLLLHEYRDLFEEELVNGNLSNTKEAADSRRHRLLYHLNSSGKYYSFKEQLKLAVVKVVREKFLNQARLGDQSQQQAFLSQLYVFLTDEMHVGLGKVFSLDDPPPPPPTVLTCDMLQHFASEAEVMGDFKLAEYYYKECLARGDHIASYWYSYGVFCLLTSDLDKSQQCFKEALSLDQNMVPGLLMYGMLCCLDGRYVEGEGFFDMATTVDPSNIVAWTMRGLYYEHSNNPIYRDMAYQEATKLSLGEQKKTYVSQKSKGAQSKLLKQLPHMGVIQQPSPSGTFTSGTGAEGSLVQKSRLLGGEGSVVRLQDHGTPLTASKVQSLQGDVMADSSPHEQSKVVASSEQTRQTLGSSVNLHETASIASEDRAALGKSPAVAAGEGGGVQQSEGSATPGGQGVQGTPGGPQPKAEGTLSTQKLVSVSGTSLDQKGGGKEGREEEEHGHQTVSIFLQTAAYLLDVHALKFAEMCLAHELTSPGGSPSSPGGSPSSHYHIAVARLHMQKHDYTKAIECLRKAIVLDIQDSNSWALMGHTHYLTGAYAEAKDAFERAIHYPTPPAHLYAVYLRLADIYMRDGEHHKAKETYLRACRKSPSSVSWRGVGIACYKLGRLDEAEDALGEANILNNLDPVVWAYLALVCLRTGRQVEAEQSLKYAIKVGLEDTSLLNEVNLLQKKNSITIL